MHHMVKVSAIREETRTTAQGQLERVMHVSFRVGPHGPFEEWFPRAGFNAADVGGRLDELARQILGLTGEYA